jgi:hypothetical protein
MATTTTAPTLRKGDAVVAAVDLRGVPAGTTGKVFLVNGLTWIRYWVRFGNGVVMGSINRSKLATPDEWERRHDEPVEAAVTTEAASDGAVEVESAGGGATINGALVPQKLLDRSKAARERLSA